MSSGTTLIVRGDSMVVGLVDADCITKAVQIAFALCGVQWVALLPNLLYKINKEWKQRLRQ